MFSCVIAIVFFLHPSVSMNHCILWCYNEHLCMCKLTRCKIMSFKGKMFYVCIYMLICKIYYVNSGVKDLPSYVYKNEYITCILKCKWNER